MFQLRLASVPGSVVTHLTLGTLVLVGLLLFIRIVTRRRPTRSCSERELRRRLARGDIELRDYEEEFKRRGGLGRREP